jgi:cytoskeleton protein RodZ
MGELGRYLRDLRAQRGMTLEEVSQVTRVGKRHLAALEAEEFAELPAPVFVKGFLRSYCEALHERPEQALAFYEATPIAFPSARPALPRHQIPRPGRRSPLVAAALLVIALAGGLAALQLATRRGADPAPPAGGATAGAGGGDAVVSPSAPAPAGAGLPGGTDAPTSAAPSVAPAPRAETAGSPPPAGVPAASAPGQRLIARATEPTWLRVQMDSGEAVQELLPAGATREWMAERRFVLTIGNAGGLELTLNGRPVPSLGARGAVIRDLVLPREDPAKPAS